MSKFTWVLIIVLLLLFMKFQYPDTYDTGKSTVVDTIDKFKSDTTGIIGYPYTGEPFECINDDNCSMYIDSYCNITTGECINE